MTRQTITVHCRTHRWELCLKDVVKNFLLRVLLVGIYYFYHNNSLNRAMQNRTCKALKQDDDKLMIPTHAGETRWIGHQYLAITDIHIHC
jgi:hypothetical protein